MGKIQVKGPPIDPLPTAAELPRTHVHEIPFAQASQHFQALADQVDDYQTMAQKVKEIMAKRDLVRDQMKTARTKDEYYNLMKFEMDPLDQQLYWYQGQMRDVMTQKLMGEMATLRLAMMGMTETFQELMHQLIKKAI